jgi:uncharacterized membrane protein
MASADARPASFADVQRILSERCHACHAAHPTFPGIAEAPKGVTFDTPQQIALLAPQIYAQVVATQAMPLGNVTEITEQERQVIAAWIAGGAFPR